MGNCKAHALMFQRPTEGYALAYSKYAIYQALFISDKPGVYKYGAYFVPKIQL